MRGFGDYKRGHLCTFGVLMQKAAVKRLLTLAFALALTLPFVVLSVVASPARAQDPAPRQPDLRMASFHDLKIRKYPDGRRLLRFSAIMVNVGAGPFEVHGQRSDTDTDTMSVAQRIYDKSGGYSDIPTSATMFYSRDGHDHWHLEDLQRYTLKRLKSRGSGPLRVGAKEGFCFFDYYGWNGSLPGSPERKQYVESEMCGGAEHEEARRADMGLSVGWSDVYEYFLPFQWIDITGLPSGRYRLYGKVDVKDQFKEEGEHNNYTWSDIEIKGNTVEVLREGPTARYCGRNGQWC